MQSCTRTTPIDGPDLPENPMESMNIGQAAAAAGVTPKMVRHYESLGLIPVAGRTDAGYRLYGEREIGMLRFIRQARSLGFPMQQIDALLSLWRDPSRQSREVKDVALRQLAELEERQRELDRMRSTLEQLAVQCRGDQGAHCAILDELANAPAPGAVEATRGRPGLKEVRAGERRPAHRTGRAEPAPVEAPHAALSAWARAAARPAGAIRTGAAP
jgi:Cu(I)-responsive transcriptional regulator